MATRGNIQEARELEGTFKANYPNRTFRIVDRSTPKFKSFAVLEVRICQSCKAEILTAAIGEDSFSGPRCKECKANRDRANAEARQVRADKQNREIWQYEQHQRIHDER